MMSQTLNIRKKLTVNNFIKEYVDSNTPNAFSQFPKLITLDAYNTIYSTEKPVLDIYVETFNAFPESKKKITSDDKKQMLENFPTIFKAHMTKYPNYGKYTPISAAEWWCLLIQATFKEANVVLNDEESLKILEPFEGKVYKTFPDLSQLLTTVKKISKTKIGICSNTDPLYHSVMKYLKNTNSDFVLPDQKFVYLSYDIDTKKNKVGEFFKIAFNSAEKEIEHLEPKDCWHIGDELENDLVGSINAGWTGICIDRGDNYGYFNRDSETEKVNSEKLTLNKINKSADVIYEEGKDCHDVLILDNGGIIIRNLFIIEQILLALKAKES